MAQLFEATDRDISEQMAFVSDIVIRSRNAAVAIVERFLPAVFNRASVAVHAELERIVTIFQQVAKVDNDSKLIKAGATTVLLKYLHSIAPDKLDERLAASTLYGITVHSSEQVRFVHDHGMDILNMLSFSSSDDVIIYVAFVLAWLAKCLAVHKAMLDQGLKPMLLNLLRVQNVREKIVCVLLEMLKGDYAMSIADDAILMLKVYVIY